MQLMLQLVENKLPVNEGLIYILETPNVNQCTFKGLLFDNNPAG